MVAVHDKPILVVHTVAEWERFLLYLVPITLMGLVAEGVVLALGIREYATDVLMRFSGFSLGIVPIEALYYMPVFMALVIAFSRYWELNFAWSPQPTAAATRVSKATKRRARGKA